MSGASERLVEDEAAELFALQAVAVLSAPEVSPVVTQLAAAITLLVQDRQARRELEKGA